MITCNDCRTVNYESDLYCKRCCGALYRRDPGGATDEKFFGWRPLAKVARKR